MAIDGAPVDAAAFDACARDVFGEVDAARADGRLAGEPDVLRGDHGDRRSSRSAPRRWMWRSSKSGSAAGSMRPTSSRRECPRSRRSPSTTSGTWARPWRAIAGEKAGIAKPGVPLVVG